MLFDTHCHLSHDKLYSQADEVVARARQAGVSHLILAAGHLPEAKTALHLARRFENTWSLAGVHPHEARDVHAADLDVLGDLLAKPECVGLGEIGLDYHYDFSPRDAQQAAFEAQLDLAARRGCPVVVHTREAFGDTLRLLRASAVVPQHVLLHSFTGTTADAEAALAYGASLSYSGIATFKNAEDIRAGAALCPADRILVETDAPYLSPEPVRKVYPNEPAHVVHVARRLAELRQTDYEDFAAQTAANACRFFRLDISAPA